ESIVIDTLYQGPCGYRSFTPEMQAEIQQDFEGHRNAMKGLWKAVRMPVRMAVEDNFAEFETVWKASGITAGNRQTGGNTLEEAFESFSLNQAQFDRLPWLIKATTAEDIRRAKREGKVAGFVSTQNT